MSYHWKKNHNMKVSISNSCSETSEAIDLSDRCDNRADNRINAENIIHKTSGVISDQIDDRKADQMDVKNQDQDKTGKRNPKCARCANHDPEPVAVKGHKRKCPFKDCECKLCLLTVQRRDLMAKTIREKRKQKEDLADNTYIYREPVFKKQRSDECSSETDRESGYSTEDNNEKSKLMDRDFDDELKQHLEGMFPIIWKKLSEHKISYIDIGQTLLFMYLKDNMSSLLKQKSTTNTITNKIIEISKQINPMTTVIPPIVPTPITPLTPTTPSDLSPLMSPPASISSIGSGDSPNEIFRTDPNIMLKGYPYLPIYHPLGTYGHKVQWPFPSVLGHRLTGL